MTAGRCTAQLSLIAACGTYVNALEIVCGRVGKLFWKDFTKLECPFKITYKYLLTIDSKLASLNIQISHCKLFLDWRTA